MNDRYINAQRKITKCLIEDEYVIWEGQPGMNDLFNFENNFGSFVFSPIFVGFAIYLLFFAQTPESSGEGLEYAFAAVLFSIFIYNTFIVYIKERRNRKKIYYFLTNKRAFIVNETTVEVISDIRNREYSVKYLKSGNMTIDFDPSIFSERTKRAGSKVLRLAFLDICHGEHVLELIKLGTFKENSSYITHNDIILENDERIMWEGKPAEGNLFYRGEIGICLFSILWTLGIAYMISTRIGIEGLINHFPITMIPVLMLFVGIYLFINRTIYI